MFERRVLAPRQNSSNSEKWSRVIPAVPLFNTRRVIIAAAAPSSDPQVVPFMLIFCRQLCGALWVCLGLFVFRVAAQFVQWVAPPDWVPEFSRWQGSSLPYPLMLATQLILIIGMAAVAWRVATRRACPNQRLGAMLTVIGVLYFAAMVLRLLLRATVLADHAWFATVLPALFHEVLATFIVVWGVYHWRCARLETEMSR